MERKKIKGELILEKITFDDALIRKVSNNNKSSGKITLPLDLIGKEVYVIPKK
jgi:putative transposon-encoded protein